MASEKNSSQSSQRHSTIPIRVCAAQRGRYFETPDL